MGKSSQKTSTTYGNTTTSNPYATASTNNGGTTASFKPGTAFDTVYNFVNKNMDSLLNEYLNPSLNSTTNQAKLNAFRTNLNNETYKNLENNIINPLSNRNMVRSSQATDLYKNLSDQNTDAVSSYINTLLGEAQDNTANVINNLLASYLQGYDLLAGMQNQSLATSTGNATRTSTSNQSVLQSVASLANAAGSLGSGYGKLLEGIKKKR